MGQIDRGHELDPMQLTHVIISHRLQHDTNLSIPSLGQRNLQFRRWYKTARCFVITTILVVTIVIVIVVAVVVVVDWFNGTGQGPSGDRHVFPLSDGIGRNDNAPSQLLQMNKRNGLVNHNVIYFLVTKLFRQYHVGDTSVTRQ